MATNKILHCNIELQNIEQKLNTLDLYSDDWFVWNEIRQEEERKLKCYLLMNKKLCKR